MDRTFLTSTDRAQAFTLEGLVSAIIVLTAVLFALQAVVITPTTGGAIDRAAMGQEEQEIRDALIVAGEKGNLSDLVRYWDPNSGEWREANAPGAGAYNSSRFAELSDFGTILDEQVVNASGRSYNVQYIEHDSNGKAKTTEQIVRMGGGTSDSVVSESYTVVVHENQRLHKDSAFNGNGAEIGGSGHPFEPDPDPSAPGSEYTIVEVRVTVW